jgi:predicted nucleic acid-binding protein
VIVVDTTVWIDFFEARGTPFDRHLVHLIELDAPVALTDVVYGEVLQGIRIVKAFAREPRERRRFHKATRDCYQRAMWVITLDSLTSPIIELMTVIAVAALPALSVQSPLFVTDWSEPSVVTVSPATVFVSSPDCTLPTSAHAKLTVTSLLFQPNELAVGLRLPEITGLVLSILMPETVAASAALPAWSVQLPVLPTD